MPKFYHVKEVDFGLMENKLELAAAVHFEKFSLALFQDKMKKKTVTTILLNARFMLCKRFKI